MILFAHCRAPRRHSVSFVPIMRERIAERNKNGCISLQAALNAVQNALSLTLRTAHCRAGKLLPVLIDKALSEDEAFFTALTDLLRQARWDDAANYVHGFKPSNFKAVRNCEGGDMETVKALRAEAKDAVKKPKSMFLCAVG